MRKMLFLVPVILSLCGCAGLAEQALQLPTGVLTQSVQNPITRAHLYRLENGLIVGVSALNSYKRLCEQKVIGPQCITVVQRLQVYVARARPALRSLRTFVRNNDQVNARVVYNTLANVISEFRTEAATAGINLPPLPALPAGGV